MLRYCVVQALRPTWVAEQTNRTPIIINKELGKRLSSFFYGGGVYNKNKK